MKNNIIGLKELRENTEKYISQVKKGRSFTVVRRSKPIFNIIPSDEWGDEGVWEKIVDFRDIERTGVSIDKVHKTLSRMNG